MTTLIVMPGTGSDADYAQRAFASAAASLGARLIALEPESDLVASYLDRLDHHVSRTDSVFVGGVSIGAVIALDWALRTEMIDRCRGVLAALPPWTGSPDDSVAAASARLTADSLADDGLESTVTQMVATSPAWLGAELSRSWRALHSRGLQTQLRMAATHVAPDVDAIAALTVPLGVAAAPDDPLHPIAVADEWVRAAPHAGSATVGLDEFGPEPRRLGEACVRAWRSAVGRSAAATAAEPRHR
ncbi:hypothetical protein [Gordonia shandongensis]|uniref:hypothetical protein n=1 Tax=Gordonia shandongensis TaxID=376351 RepID=UPI0004026240|nr:hypothetical protein [Gordonia shandongensis]